MIRKEILTVLTIIVAIYIGNAQNVTIPDSNFKNFLIADLSINTNGDTEIQVSEANAFTGAIQCNGLSISDLTGIEEFIGIQTLNCSDNPLINNFLDLSANTVLKRLTSHNSQLRSIDISTNTALEYLDLHDNDLINIDVSTNIALKNILLDNNYLTSLDVSTNIALVALSLAGNYQLGSIDVSSNINLKHLNVYNTGLTSLDVSVNVGLLSLECSLNQLIAIDVSANVLLDWFTCSGNQLTSLDISHNSILRVLDVSNNQLTSLDVSHNPILGLLDVSNNQLTSLDVSSNTVLVTLHGDFNQFTNLDLSNNINLSRVILNNNQLTSLNVANGSNLNILDFRINNNPNLLCVEVDDLAYSNSSTIWNNKDTQTNYSLNCSNTPCIVTIPDANFKSYLVNNSAINTNGDAEIQCSEAAAFSGVINCSNRNISDLTGIEFFTSVTELNCSYNQLTTINVSFNTSLVKFYCQSNQLTILDVSNNQGLQFLNCGYNQIKDLDITGNTSLRYFWSKNNLLKNLDMANGQNHAIFSFNIRGNANLLCVRVDPSTIISTNTIWTNKDSQTYYSTGACPVVPIAIPMQLRTSIKVSLYPNPTKEMFYVEKEGAQISKIEVLDTLGRVLIVTINTNEGINVSDLKSGLYSVKIYSGNSFTIKRLIKE